MCVCVCDNGNGLFVHIFSHRNIVEFFISKLAIILCTAGCNNYKLNYTASRQEEFAWIIWSTKEIMDLDQYK